MADPAGQGSVSDNMTKGQSLEMPTGEFRGEYKPDTSTNSPNRVDVPALTRSGPKSLSDLGNDLGDEFDVLALDSSDRSKPEPNLDPRPSTPPRNTESSQDPLTVREVTL